MGTSQFDREAFVPPKNAPARNPLFVLILGSVGVVLALTAFVAYRSGFKNLGFTNSPAKSEQLTSIEEKLATMEQRLGQLEKKRKNPDVVPLVSNAEKPNHNGNDKDTASWSRISPRILTTGAQRVGNPQN